MKLPAVAGIFIYISEIYMKMPATAGIFIYIFEIYMKMPATAGNFIYISWSQGDSIRHGQNIKDLLAGDLTITPSYSRYS